MSLLLTPEERETEEKLLQQIKLFTETEVFREFSNSVQSIFMILNSRLQIVFMNERLHELLGLPNGKELFGSRLGEVLKCFYANDLPGGCGTTKFCAKCGSVQVALKALKGTQAMEDCRIRTHNNKALDLRVLATPYKVMDECFSVLSLTDISSEKRLKSLEKIFYHDVLNSAGGISSLSESLLEDYLREDDIEIIRLINAESNKLIQEIKYQKRLTNTEFGDLKVSLTKINAKAILEDLVKIYRNHESSEGKHIIIDGHVPDIDFVTDIVLLHRVIGNMVKNAMEATGVGETVTVSCAAERDAVLFAVSNNAIMEDEIQLQIFRRSFSTKGTGRGLGTYSMKLLGENYLKGKVWFESSKEKGTTFFLKIPLNTS